MTQNQTKIKFFLPFLVFLLILSCRADEDKIVGGTEAPIGRYEYIALLMGEEDPFCAGTLVSPEYVLSAAHCSHHSYTVQIGRHDLTDDFEDYEEIDVEAEIIHPDFNSIDLNFDFMLIKLAWPSEYQTIIMDDGSMDLAEGRDVTVMGWGAECEGGDFSDVLLETEVDVVSITNCRNQYPNGAVTDNMICAAREDRDACQGDSGGPLIVNKGWSDEDVQVGIISWGYGCADPDFPGVYSRVGEAYDWIMETIEEGVDTNDILKFQMKGVLGRAWKFIHNKGRNLRVNAISQ